MQYPDHNLSFQVFTDAKDLQLGAIILQKGVPIAFYSRKLNSFQNKQINYLTIEKELLSIKGTLNSGPYYMTAKKMHVHTDHKNLRFQT